MARSSEAEPIYADRTTEVRVFLGELGARLAERDYSASEPGPLLTDLERLQWSALEPHITDVMHQLGIPEDTLNES